MGERVRTSRFGQLVAMGPAVRQASDFERVLEVVSKTMGITPEELRERLSRAWDTPIGIR